MLYKSVDCAAGDGVIMPLPSTAMVNVRFARENMHQLLAGLKSRACGASGTRR